MTQEEIPNNQDSNPLVVCGGDIRNQGSDTLFGPTDSIAGIRANAGTIPGSETLIAGTRANIGTSQIDTGLNGVETIGTGLIGTGVPISTCSGSNATIGTSSSGTGVNSACSSGTATVGTPFNSSSVNSSTSYSGISTIGT